MERSIASGTAIIETDITCLNEQVFYYFNSEEKVKEVFDNDINANPYCWSNSDYMGRVMSGDSERRFMVSMTVIYRQTIVNGGFREIKGILLVQTIIGMNLMYMVKIRHMLMLF